MALVRKFFGKAVHHLNKQQSCSVVTNRLSEATDRNVQQSKDLDPTQIRYNVCREKKSNQGNKFVFNKPLVIGQNKDETSVRQESDEQSVDENGDRILGPDSKRRIFEESITKRSVTLPLKMSKLANPFPEPVKTMPSHTVSDQEKADQMQAEFRAPTFAKNSY